MCTSFKTELLSAYHNFSSTNVARTVNTVDVFKAALYLASATQGPTTIVYGISNEVSGTGYTAGGVTVTNGTAPTSSGTTAFWTPTASFSWTNVTLATSFDCVLLYNSSQSNRAVSVHTFGAQVVTSANFTLTQPVNDSANALLRIA